MEELVVNKRSVQKLGEDWIEAIVGKDFEGLAKLCQPDVSGSLLLPKRIPAVENMADLTKEVERWFGHYDSIEKEQSRIAMVGEKLAIFYRLRCIENGTADLIEQQIYCSMLDGRIKQLRLLCSGFQPDLVYGETQLDGARSSLASFIPSSKMATPHSHALLEFKANGSDGSTCALLTPFIKQKLGELNSGQVLEVHVDDITAKEDIESWSRLSGNALLKIDQRAGHELVFYISKK